MSSARSSGRGSACRYRRLCLLADFDSTVCEEAWMVSLYVTIGSVLIIGTPAYTSCKSYIQISICNSPEPAIICSPVSSVVHNTNGSLLLSLFIPSTNLGKSALFLGLIATLTTGLTEYFIVLILKAVSQSLIVPVFAIYRSNPISPAVLPHGILTTDF
mmetsp:Transcript_8670/g.1202  ORF Transcript_8670/g.1202 Transcript_8670/m.1202 type:complete len:159 (+) Transcript_8670:757-1233(+)